MDVLQRVIRTNGNVMVVRRGDPDPRSSGPGAMSDSDQSGVCYDSDWNSNQFLVPDSKRTDRNKSLDDSFFEKYANMRDNANREQHFRVSPSSPPSLRSKDLSYDDLSKNIDANLAEIDMETFRSEDIHSILALPAIYSGGDPFEGRGEQVASLSGSLLGGLDASTSNRAHSEDEISICKDDGPLFSPLREPHAAISVDSLDNSSSGYEQDLVLTCKANKNNYTIVFEGSSTQFSDDSDYQDVCRSSEGEGSLSGAGKRRRSGDSSSLEASLTTWSRLWKSQRVQGRGAMQQNKSRSLPNLSHDSVLITDKQLSQWAKWCGNQRFPLYELIHNYQQQQQQAGKEGLHSVSLLKLFMRHRVASHCSSSSSGSDSSLILQPLSFRSSLQGSLEAPEWQRRHATEEAKQRMRNENETNRFVDNIQLLDWNSVQNLTETNNNNIRATDDSPNNNNNNPLPVGEARPGDDNSQYFEDSLMENAPPPQLKHFHATPIKEEEETDTSSGDEAMRDSRNAFGSSDDSSGGLVTVRQNDAERVACGREAASQTRRLNMNECARPLHPPSCRSSSNQTDCDAQHSRDSSPASSGYVSSRHSSVERLRHSAQGPAPKSGGPAQLATTCTCGTQIPVHVRDSSAQTFPPSCPGSGFTLKESTTHLPEPDKQRFSYVPDGQRRASPQLQRLSCASSQTRRPREKSVYVCYPNYSLPDLSFLRSVIDDNTESVFLTPTEFRPPPDLLRRRPKSATAYEALLQKHAPRIRDWESLNVLLPDDLKALLSRTAGLAASCSDALRRPRGILRKSSSAEQCEERSRASPDRDAFQEASFQKLPRTPECCGKKERKGMLENLREEEGGRKAVKFCERSPTKNARQPEECGGCACDPHVPDSDRPPHEFLVSPTRNPLAYPPDDSYSLQNFSGGGKFFQEALRRKTGLVENLRKATQIIFEHHKNSKKKGVPDPTSLGQKILTCLCPAVHAILSDGLLPSVQGFFGPLPNSPWKVAGASVKQGETRKEVEDLLNHVTSEKLLTDSTYRFNAFIIGLLNLGCFEWWLGHLCACQSLVCHHYHPTALLSLLALPAAVHLRHELKELVSPLSPLPFRTDIALEARAAWKKFDAGNHRPVEGATKSSPRKKAANDFSLKSKGGGHRTAPVMNIRGEEDCHENQVWPGITINPFPNARFTEEPAPRREQQRPLLRDTFLPLEGRPSLCSSADSGCSSQIDHAHAPANDVSPCVDLKEGQQFKMLRQKWEKISHGMTKQTQPANRAATSPGKSVKAAVSSSAKAAKKKEACSPPRTPKTPPARRSQAKGAEPVAPPSPTEGAERRRSQIPTLRMSGAGKGRSMIPVQRSQPAARARSANARCPSD